MGNQGRGGKKLNVARELFLLEANVEALRLAAERKLKSSSPASELALIMTGSLHVLRDRLRLIERILLGEINPRMILCQANQADSSESGPGIVEEWSPEEEVQRLAAEWRGARNRAELAKQAEAAKDMVITHKKPDDKRSN